MKAIRHSHSKNPDVGLLERRAKSAIRKIAAVILEDQAASDNKTGAAAWSLHRLAFLVVDELALLTGRKPGLFQPIAETSMVWPAFISPHRGFSKGNQRLLETLQVGSRSLLKIIPKSRQKKQWSFSTPATQIAQTMIREIEGMRAYYRAKRRDELDSELSQTNAKLSIPSGGQSLPTDFLNEDFLALKDFNEQSALSWSEVGWKILLQQTGERPEEFFDLVQMGEHRRKHSEYEGAQRRVTIATGNSNVRDGFRDRLQKAFRMCAQRPEGLPR